MWDTDHCRMAPVLLAWVVGLISPVMSAPRASAQPATLDSRVTEIEARPRLHDNQVGELKSQIADMPGYSFTVTHEGNTQGDSAPCPEKTAAH